MRIRATLASMATAILCTSPAAAEDATDSGPSMEVYGTLLPFFENVGTQGATAAATNPAPLGYVHPTPTGAFTGRNHERRFRMTSGTSHLGFRGDLPISQDVLKLIWQVESPTPIDGEGPNSWASRNSHVGFTGNWGTLIYGNWDTPMKWATTISVNPIKGGYVADMIGIIGTPGHSTPAFNPDPATLATYQTFVNRAGFFRHETNTVQYWSPTLAGFSVRAMYQANEHRLAGVPGQEVATNPYLVSGSIGYDNDWLRLRYSAEMHNDFFGTGGALGGANEGLNLPTSQDVGHLGLAMVTINRDTPYKTRVVVVGDYLSYHTDDIAEGGQGAITDISRAAVYALAQQSFGKHSVWGAWGAATEGSCTVGITPPIPCTTAGLGAYYLTAGYLYSFTEDSGIFAVGYGLFNDYAARYSPFPYLDYAKASADYLPNLRDVSPGSDMLGFGIGFVHKFNAPLMGGGGGQATPAPKAEAPTRKTEPEPPEPEPEPEAEEPDEQTAAEEGEEADPEE